MSRIRSFIPKEKYLTKDIIRVITRAEHIKGERPAPSQVPKYYEFVNRAKIISGYRAMNNIPAELKKRNSCRPLIITQHEYLEKGFLRVLLKILSSYGIEDKHVFLCFSTVSSDYVNQAKSEFKRRSCNSIIAVGGKSAFSIAMSIRGIDSDQIHSVPYIAVPIANCGLEIIGAPDIVVLDPRLSKEQSPKSAVLHSIDTICHAVETYTNPQRNPMSDAYAISSLKLIRGSLHKAVKYGKDRRVRLALANASLLSSIAFMNSGPGISHIIAQVIEEKYKISHLEAIAIVFPHYLSQNILRYDGYYGDLLLPLAGPEIYADTMPYMRGRKFVHMIRNMINDYHQIHGFPVCLSEIGVKRMDFDIIIEKSLERVNISRDVDRIREGIRNILNISF